jgi:hypothetical protein
MIITTYTKSGLLDHHQLAYIIISTMKLWCLLLLLLLYWQKLALLDLSYWPAKKEEKNMVAVRVS